VAQVTVEIDAQAMRWLHALAVVRDCSIEDLLQQGPTSKPRSTNSGSAFAHMHSSSI